jgi:hypothetical protein
LGVQDIFSKTSYVRPEIGYKNKVHRPGLGFDHGRFVVLPGAILSVFFGYKNRNMKKSRLLLWMSSLCLANQSFAQDCSHYFYLQKDKTVTVTLYDKKGAPNGKNVYKISDVNASGAGLSAKLASEVYDKKGKLLVSGNSSCRCDGGALFIDMKMMIPQEQQEKYKTEVTANNVYLEYPASMKAGDALKDGNITMDLNTNGMQQTLTMIISDRKVEAQESVTTEAGTWNCFKISFKAKLTIKTGPIGIPFNFEGFEWFAPGFGVVKTESKHGSSAVTAIQ